MTIEEFEDLVDRLGEDLSAWPEGVRKAGELLLKNSAEAREIVQEAGLMRRAFAPGRAARAPAGLADSIVLRATSRQATPPLAVAASQGGFAVPIPRLPLSFRPAMLLPLCFVIGLAASLLPVWDRGAASQIEVPTFFQACCGTWSMPRNE